MSLINCPSCKSPVSSQAASCPRCGHPVGSRGINVPLATIQLTSKRLKAHKVLSVGLIIFCIVAGIILGKGKQIDPPLMIACISAGAIGIPWYFITKLRIWWHHK